MLLSLNRKRKVLILIGLLITAVHALVGFSSVPKSTKTSKNLFAPSIEVILQGESKSFLGENQGCQSVEYQIYIRNTSTNFEVIDITSVGDPLDVELNVDFTSLSGDDSPTNGLLDAGETWEYKAYRKLETTHYDAKVIQNQITVTGNVVGQPGDTVSDDSHPTDFKDAEPTFIEVPCDSGISLIKTAEAKDPLGDSGGCSVIEYTFYVSHNGKEEDVFSVWSLQDPSIPGFSPTLIEGDGNTAGKLEEGETWVLKETVAITAADILAGQAVNQAYFYSELDNSNPTSYGTDVSDYMDPNEDRPTVVDLSHCVPQIALQKVANLKDCTEIEYTFTVLNLSPNLSFSNVSVTDLDLPIVPAGPTGDVDNDTFLDPDETWTYTDAYALTETDLQNGSVQNTARVAAQVVEFPGLTITDDSHPSNITLDGPTTTDLSGCIPAIAIVKEGTLDANCTNIDYTFTVTNESANNQILDNVAVTDLDLALVLAGPSGDEDNDTFLDPDETWTYTASYPITATDLNNGQVDNNATVDAHVLGMPAITVTDISHPSDTALDGPTQTDLSGCAPAIAIVKDGTVDANCTNIDYTFTVTNESANNQILDNVVVTDLDLALVLAGPFGDANTIGALDPDETWTYTASYPITATDLNNGQVDNSATVDAHVLGFPAITVTDDSHPTDVNADGPTQTDLSGCAPAIAIVKDGTVDANCTNIDYTFTVTNESANNQILDNVVVTDLDLALVLAGPFGDANTIGALDPGEIWTYTASYPITATDLNNGQVDNNATVDAHVLGFPAITVTDDSHPTDVLLDGNTTTDLSPCQNPNLGLIKQGQLSDLDQDGCNESILYTFTVLNNGNTNLLNLELEDPLFMGTIAGPVVGTDDGNDGVLSIGEIWTYEIYYAITDQNLLDGDVINQAVIRGWTPNNVEVADDSDDDSYTEDQATETTIESACVNSEVAIGLIKLGSLTDLNDDGCPETISYTFMVSNRGGEPLDSLSIEDNFLGTDLDISLESGDNNSNDVLDLGEEWIFTTSYLLTDQDFETGYVENVAVVSAQSLYSLQSVLDFSDDNSFDENDPTRTSVVDGCDPEDNPGGNPIDDAFEVFTGITPNGDGINEYFRINGIENYPENTLKIFNRWGVLVFEAEGYGLGNNLFSGVSEGRATILQQRTLPSGTYFYTLKFENENPGQESYSGYLYINRD